MNGRSHRGALLLSSAVAGAVFFIELGGVASAAEATYKFNIPAEPLSQALTEFGLASSHQIIFSETLVKGQRTSGLHGDYTSRKALEVLLSGTNLTAEANSAGVLMVRQKNVLAASNIEAANLPVPEIETLIVTAQKREQRLIDVPMSIVALSGNELGKREINGIDDLQAAVPNLTIQSDGVNRSLYIRGTANTFGSSSLIGLYLDEADVTAPTGAPFLQPDVNTYDLQRVEVLRGPQGTLFGDGSAGGTLRLITNNPDLTKFAFSADVAGLVTESGAPGERVQAMVNVPLIDNQLGLRLAATFENKGGWIDQPAANRDDVNGQNLADVRLKGLWRPTDKLTVGVLAEVHHNTGMQNINEQPKGSFTQVFGLTTTPSFTDDFHIYNLTVAYDLGAVRILSTTSYIDHIILQKDYGRTFEFTPPGTPLFQEYYSAAHKSVDVNQELRASSTGPGPWQWTVGGFYRRSRLAFEEPGFFFGIPGPPGAGLPPIIPFGGAVTRSEAEAAFGDTSYRIADRLTLGVGVRYFEDRQTFVSGTTQTGTFHSFDPRVYAQFKLSKDVNLYASAAKGFRSGGFNSLGQPGYGPEAVWTYEIGAKASLFEGRLSAYADFAYSDYKNYQIIGVLPPPQPPIAIVSNGGAARIDGLEWNLAWRPAPGWSLGFNGNYLFDYKFTKLNVSNSAYVVGDKLDFTPRYSFNTFVERDFAWRDKPGYVRVDYSQIGSENYRNRSLGPWYHSTSDVVGLLNFKASLQWNDNLRLGIFGQNLLNDRGFISPIVIEANAARSRPRTFGIEFGAAF